MSQISSLSEITALCPAPPNLYSVVRYEDAEGLATSGPPVALVVEPAVAVVSATFGGEALVLTLTPSDFDVVNDDIGSGHSVAVLFGQEQAEQFARRWIADTIGIFNSEHGLGFGHRYVWSETRTDSGYLRVQADHALYCPGCCQRLVAEVGPQ